MTGVGATTQAYDALGRLRSRTDTVGTTTFGYSAAGQDPVSVGSDVIARLPGGGQLSVSDTTSSWFTGRDRHGDVTTRYTPTGAITGSVAYNPFGETTATAGSGIGGFGYQGDWTDPTTGLVNQGTRWYQPTTGTFASRDSFSGRLESPVSLNRYTYGANNPLRYFDPDGRESADAALAGLLFGTQWSDPKTGPVLTASYNSSIELYQADQRAAETEALLAMAQTRIDVMSFAGTVGGDAFNANTDGLIRDIAHTIVSINHSVFDNAAHNNALDGNISKNDFQEISKTGAAAYKFAADVLLSDNTKFDPSNTDQMVGWRAWETKPKQNWLERNGKTLIVMGVGILAGMACGGAGPVVAAMCGGAAARFTAGMLNGDGFGHSLGSAFNPKSVATDAAVGLLTAGAANLASRGVNATRAAFVARSGRIAANEIDEVVHAGTNATRPLQSVNATNTERLAGRVDDFHGALDPIAQNSRTTSVMSTRQGTDIIASGGRDLSPAQRALAQEGDVLGRLPGAHAEVTALDAATKAGLTPAQIAVSRPICGPCQAVIQSSGGEILPGGMGAFWPR